MVDEVDDTASSMVAGTVTAVGVIVWKVSVGRGIRELGFLYTHNKHVVVVLPRDVKHKRLGLR